MPHERRDAIERPGRGGEARERRPESALPVDHVLAPESMEQVVVLDRELDGVADVLPEPGVDRAHVAATEHQVHASAREVLEHRVVLGDLHRVVGGDERHGRGQDDALGARGDVAQHRGRRRGHERRVVVLAGGEHVEAELLRLEREGDHRLDALVLRGGRAGGGVGGDVTDAEDAELHVPQLTAFLTGAAMRSLVGGGQLREPRTRSATSCRRRCSPSSSKPNVAYSLELVGALEEADDLAVLGQAGIPYQVFGERTGALALTRHGSARL